MGLFDKFSKKNDDKDAKKQDAAQTPEAKDATPSQPAEDDHKDLEQQAAAENQAAKHDDFPTPAPGIAQLQNDELLVRWRNHQNEASDDTMSAFLDELIERSRLILVVFSEKDFPLDDTGIPTIPEDTELQFPLLQTQDDSSFQPVFTDWQSVNELFDQWDANDNHDSVMKAKTLAIDFRTLAMMIADNKEVNGAVINPFSDNISLDRDSLADLAKQQEARHAQEDANEGDGPATDEDGQPLTFEISEPTAVPDGMVASLNDKLATNNQVHRAWLRLMTYQDQTNYFLIVDHADIPEAEEDAFFDELRAIGTEFIPSENHQTLVVGRYNDDMKNALEGADPIFPA